MVKAYNGHSKLDRKSNLMSYVFIRLVQCCAFITTVNTV